MRTTKRAALVFLAASLMLVPQILAQNPTGSLIGNVSDSGGGALPGVTITVTSPSLQGTRTTQAGSNGDYKLGFLPPGEYKATYELEGFATSIRTVKLSAAQTSISDITMELAEVTEEIVVTSNLETISETQTVATTFTKDEIENLPISRDINSTVSLAPGVHSTGPSGNITINGAMSFENLWMINGVVINENVRGQSLPLFIEDAVQETTTSTAGISAEYGRFTGGVVNVITKSGGNQFSGSIRANISNEDWEDETALDVTPNVDDINQEYEATFGGPLWKDRIWFFTAGRDRATSGTGQTVTATDATGATSTPFSYATTDDETRLEGKLTLGITPSHSLIGSYLEIERTRAGSVFGSVLDLASLNNRTDPQEISSINYTGILSSNFFVEAQYSERNYVIAKGLGGPGPDAERSIESLIPGVMMRHRPTARRYFSSTFCGSCEDEQRDNENTLVKGSYFLTTDSAGSHDFAFGYDTYTDIRFSINHQSGSDFQAWSTDIVFGNNGEIFPVITPSQTWLIWWPPYNLDIAAPTDFTTNSVYANDSWQLNENWSFNIGVRYDENDGTDSGGNTTVDDSKVSPRLGASYDTKGDGDLVFNLSYGTYVAAIANTRADSTSTGGALGGFGFSYGGPAINNTTCITDPSTCVSTTDALRTVFDWYTGVGGATTLVGQDVGSLPNLIFGCVPGATSFVPDTLKSPAADELTLGVTKRLGSKGIFRADVIYREWEDFYSNRSETDIPPALVNGTLLDVTEVGNFGDDVLERDYIGLNLQARYRLTDRLSLNGNWTLSELEGNINGETSGSGPVPSSPRVKPEYQDNAWAFPVGNLSADQRHKIRAWAVYDILDNEHHSLNVSVLQNFFSGTPYSIAIAVNSAPFVTNPGYQQTPSSVTYFVSDRGEFTTEDITRTDLSLNYAFRWNAFGKSMEVFLQPEVINLFGEEGVVSPNLTINDAVNGGCTNGCATFDPFTQTPVEGVHYELGPQFLQADSPGDFQQVRTFRFSLGFRF